jgi:pimeloyl-ACP methyl ester carboxylesterase
VLAQPEKNWQDIYFTSRDGLRLYGRRYRSPAPIGRPALCLPGLTRNTRDFHALATFLSSAGNPASRDVYAVDYRGRGLSAHDPDWHNYTVKVELADVLDFATLTGLHDATVIGTSRGGILAMLMAAARPTLIGAAVLNDIGPVLERDGLMRIAAYVGRVPLPNSWSEAAALARSTNERHFPAVGAEAWEDIARQWFNDHHDRPAHGYDQNLAKAMSVLDGRAPKLWPQFRALTPWPTLVIRGEHSDLLSAATVRDMQQAHPRLDVLTVPGQGHAPLLRDTASLQAVSTFLARADSRVATPHRNPAHA